MRRSSLLPVLIASLGLGLACSDTTGPEPTLYPDGASAGITDALHQDGGVTGNPHFFWLAPIVSGDPSASFGTFDPAASPVVTVVCHSASGVGATCTGAPDPIATFTLGDGVLVQDGQYHLQFDTKAAFGTYTLRTSVADGPQYTYRIVVTIDGDAGTIELGHADFQLAESGKDIKNLSSDDMIGLKDGRMLPVKFRIDLAAYDYGVANALFASYGDDGYPDPELCATNCAVEQVDPETGGDFFLFDPRAGFNTTGVRFGTEDLPPLGEGEEYTLVIDQRLTDDEIDDGYTCYYDADLAQWDCYRYLLFPEPEAFNNPVLVGICDYSALLNDSPESLQIGKADYYSGEGWSVDFLEPMDATDLLSCAPAAVGSLTSFRSTLRLAFDWLVPPAYAQRTTRVIGGMANDFSDFFLTPYTIPSELPGTIIFEAENPDNGGSVDLFALTSGGTAEVLVGDDTDDRDGVVSNGSLAWSAHTPYLAGSEPSAKLRVLNLTTSVASDVITTGLPLQIEPDLNTTGTVVAFATPHSIASPMNFDIYTVALSGGATLQVTDGAEATTDPCTSESPAWSLDGSALAYATNCGGAWMIVVLEHFNTEFEAKHEYTVGAYAPRSLAWLGDGHIVYEANFHLYAMDVSDGSHTPLTPASDTSVEVSDPVISPDGTWIAFAYIQGAGREIWAFQVPDLTNWDQVLSGEASFVVGPESWVLVTDEAVLPRPTDWMPTPTGLQ